MNDTTSTRQGNPCQRAFIRHSAHVPIHVTHTSTQTAARTIDIGHGGLAFDHRDPLPLRASVHVRIATLDGDFNAWARVVWCQRTHEGYRVGVCFPDPDDAFRARMVEQICAIEAYRREVLASQGRYLDRDEAAREWIERFGGRFPDP